MSQMVVKIVLFSILLNLAGGVMMTAVVNTNNDNVFDRSDTGATTYNGTEDYSGSFEGELEETIEPAGSVEDQGDQVYRVMDTISLGFIYKFIGILDDYMYGFVNVLDATFDPLLNDDLQAILFGNQDPTSGLPLKFGVFKLIITISYMLLGIKLLTGQDVTGE